MITPRRFVHILTAPLLVAALAACTSSTPAPSPAPAGSVSSASPSETVSVAEAREKLRQLNRLGGPEGSTYPPSNGILDLDRTATAILGPGAEPDTKATTKNRLTQDGFLAALHQSWTAPDGTAADILVLRFSADAGAESLAGSLAQGMKTTYPDTVFTDPVDLATGAVVSDLDGRDKASVLEVAPHGDAVVLVSYFTPATPDRKAAAILLHNQFKLLPTPGTPW
ncbi:hypothetical protein ACFYS8_02120 [Kitasatospora sp. NPDC004615]|uniref:DUF7373 family lipoprotein n=1 Tax=unclassified Kitasatospora TaxID=2633591 RepID=UPI0036B2358A